MKPQGTSKERRFSTAGLPLPVLGKTTLLEESRPVETVSFPPATGGARGRRIPFEGKDSSLGVPGRVPANGKAVAFELPTVSCPAS